MKLSPVEKAFSFLIFRGGGGGGGGGGRGRSDVRNNTSYTVVGEGSLKFQ